MDFFFDLDVKVEVINKINESVYQLKLDINKVRYSASVMNNTTSVAVRIFMWKQSKQSIIIT